MALTNHAGEQNSTGRSLSTVPIPNLAASCPSILQEVIFHDLDSEWPAHLPHTTPVCCRCCSTSMSKVHVCLVD